MADADHAAELRELESLHNAGKIDQSAYEGRRSKLLAEASRPKPKMRFRTQIAIGLLIIVGLVAIRLLANIFNIAM